MPVTWQIDKTKRQPAYQQIIEQIIDEIQAGMLAPGERLPSERKLADLYMVNRSTVIKALEELNSLGWITRKQGSGTHVLEGRWGNRQPPLSHLRSSLDNPYLKQDPYVEQIEQLRKKSTALDLYTGDLPIELVPDFQLPAFTWDAILAEERNLDSSGYLPLQQTVLTQLKNQLAIDTRDQKLVITSGSTQGISLLMQVLLQPGDSIITEEPSFLFALPLFASMRVRLIGIQQDQEGLAPNKLESALKENKIKFVYLNPTFQNPTGRTISHKRRIEILKICQNYQVPIIEDDVFCGLSLQKDLPKLKALAPDSVIYLGSLSKIFGSSIKIGWLLAPRALTEQLAQAKKRMSIETNIFPQIIANCALQSSDHPQQQALLLQALQERKKRIEKFLENFKEDWLFQPITGGLYIWITWRHRPLNRGDWQLFLENHCLIAPSFLFSNETSSFRLNYTRLSEETFDYFKENFIHITKRLKERKT